MAARAAKTTAQRLAQAGANRRRAAAVACGVVAYVLPALLTLAVLLHGMAGAGIVPFGDHPFLARDGAIQYVGFYGWYHNVLTGAESLDYSFAKGLGGGTFGLYAYYLSSPWALLAQFYEPADMPALFSVLMVGKLCLAAFTCGAFLYHRFGRRTPAVALLGCAYALGSYSFVDGLNVMWLDALYMLPLVAWGVYRIVCDHNPALLVASVGATVVFTWYGAYMVCLYAVLYLVLEINVREPGEGLRAGVATRRTLAALALGVACGAAILVPAVLGQLSNAGVESGSSWASVLGAALVPEDPAELLRSLFVTSSEFAGAANSVRVSVVLLALAAAMFLLPGLRRQKAWFALLIALFVASFLLKPLDMVWTGFTRADSYNPRYFFLFEFTLCLCAGWAVSAIGHWSREVGSVAASGVLAVACAVVMVVDAGALTGECLADTAYNGYSSGSATAYARYIEGFEDANATLADVAGDGGGLLRIENADASSMGALQVTPDATDYGLLTPYITTGERMSLGMSGIAHYSSAGSGTVKRLLGSLGYATLPGTRSATTYNSPLFMTDSLLGIRYVYAQGKPAASRPVGVTVDLPAPYGTSVQAYEYPYALPLGFGVPDSLRSFTWATNPFNSQERLMARLAGVNERVRVNFDQPGADPVYNHPERVQLYEPARVMRFDELDEAEPGTVHAAVTATENGPLYLRVATSVPLRLFVDGRFEQSVGHYEFDGNLVFLGDHAVGDVVFVRLESAALYEYGQLGWNVRAVANRPLWDEVLDVSQVRLDVRTLDFARAIEMLQELAAEPFEAQVVEAGRIEGAFSAGEGRKLLLTVPYEAGWTARVDGAETPVENVNGLIALAMEPGEHAVALEYETPGRAAGRAVSVLAALAAATWCAALFVLGRRRQDVSIPTAPAGAISPDEARAARRERAQARLAEREGFTIPRGAAEDDARAGKPGPLAHADDAAAPDALADEFADDDALFDDGLFSNGAAAEDGVDAYGVLPDAFGMEGAARPGEAFADDALFGDAPDGGTGSTFAGYADEGLAVAGGARAFVGYVDEAHADDLLDAAIEAQAAPQPVATANAAALQQPGGRPQRTGGSHARPTRGRHGR